MQISQRTVARARTDAMLTLATILAEALARRASDVSLLAQRGTDAPIAITYRYGAGLTDAQPILAPDAAALIEEARGLCPHGGRLPTAMLPPGLAEVHLCWTADTSFFLRFVWERSVEEMSRSMNEGDDRIFGTRPTEEKPRRVLSPEKMAAVKAKALAKARAILEPHRKPMWVPQVAPGDSGPTASKYFGAPWLADGENWPEVTGEPARFVLQLDVATLPAPMRALLGGQGLLQFFYQTGGGASWPKDMRDLALVRLVHPDRVSGGAVPQPEDAIDDIEGPRLPLAIVGWEERSDLPRSEDYRLLRIGRKLDAAFKNLEDGPDDEIDEAYQGDKLGGWPFWTQGNETPKDRRGRLMIPVYQIDAGCFFDGLAVPAHAPGLFAGDGTGHIFVSADDPHELCFLWACG